MHATGNSAMAKDFFPTGSEMGSQSVLMIHAQEKTISSLILTRTFPA